MLNFKKNLNPYEPANIFEPDHLLAILGTILFFVGAPIAAFLSANQVPAFKDGQTAIFQLTWKTNVLSAKSEQYVRNLTPSADKEEYAEISGNKVIYTHDTPSIFPELYVLDLSNNSTKKIGTINPYASTAMGIDGNKIVWSWNHDNPSGPTDIFLYDLSTNTTRQLTNESCHVRYPAISGNRVVYASDKNNSCNFTYDIYMYDLSTSSERQITTNLSNQVFPEIWGNYVVYADNRNGNYDIYLYDLATDNERRITTDAQDQTFPDISGNKIVWQDTRGNNDIYLYDLSTNSERVVASTAQSQLSPSIYGNKVVWQDWRNGNGDVYVKDLSTNAETRITYDSANQGRVDISGERIVWTDWRNGTGNENIYIYDPPGPPSPPPPPPPSPSPTPFKKVDICHRNADGNFVRITVADQATYTGHLAHSGDIIPATTNCQPPTIKDINLPDVFKKPSSSSTDLSKITDFSKVENLVLDTTINTIKFKEAVDLSSADVVEKFKELHKYVLADEPGIITLDSKALPALNKKASLTMKDLPYLKTPRVLVNGKEDKKVVSNIKYSKGTLTFDVTHFTTFATAPALLIEEPDNNFKTSNNKITLKGSISDPTATVSASLNGKEVGKLKVATQSGKFSRDLNLEIGLNKIIISAISINGATASATISGTLVSKSGSWLPFIAAGIIVLMAAVCAVYFWEKRKKINSEKKDQSLHSAPSSN